jgi:hypothetical protein
MSFRHVVLAGLAAGLLATAAAAADEAAPAGTPAPTAAPASDSAAENQVRRGEKEYKERVNIVARKPLRHDINWIDSRDRSGWREFTTWQGIRDERPLVARKVFGFHEPRPHIRRAERVERISRGPLRGPAPSE